MLLRLNIAVVETAEYFILNGPEHVTSNEIFDFGRISLYFVYVTTYADEGKLDMDTMVIW